MEDHNTQVHCSFTVHLHQMVLGLFELLTFVSLNSDVDWFSLAFSPVDGIVSNSRGHHSQLSMSLFASCILHLRTEWIHHHSNLEHWIHKSMSSYSLSTSYLNYHVKVCPKYRLCMLDWELQFSRFCVLLDRPCDPMSCLPIHFPLLPGACGEHISPWKLILSPSRRLHSVGESCDYGHWHSCMNFQLTFRIFVVWSDIFSVVTIRTFGADVFSHRFLVLLDL